MRTYSDCWAASEIFSEMLSAAGTNLTLRGRLIVASCLNAGLIGDSVKSLRSLEDSKARVILLGAEAHVHVDVFDSSSLEISLT